MICAKFRENPRKTFGSSNLNKNSKIRQKFLMQNFENVFHSFVRIGTENMCVRFRENWIKIVSK